MSDIQKILERFEIACGKKAKETIEFPANGTFSAHSAAEKKAKDMGYAVGSMCRDEPIGLAKDFGYIAKWKNLDKSDRAKVEAGLLSTDFREGDVVLAIFE